MNKIITIATIVLAVAIVVGFSVRIFLDYKTGKELEQNTKFPPWPSKCPDYWAVLGDGKCHNVHKIGICKSGDTDNIMDFSEPIFKGNKGMYYKCNWAKKCNTPWEGIDSIC